MDTIYRDKNKYIFRLDKGEEFINSIQNFCEKENIKAGWLQAIGSLADLDLAYFDTKIKEYEIKNFKRIRYKHRRIKKSHICLHFNKTTP